MFNNYPNLGHGTPIFDEMSQLDSIMNQIYHVVQTSWSQSAYEYAMKDPAIYDTPVIMTVYPHLYVIRLSWTPTTWIGLALALLIAINACVLAVRWARATFRFGLDASWNLLTPVDLMAYTLAAYEDLIHDLNTVENRRMAMRGTTSTTLRERPIWEGTGELVSPGTRYSRLACLMLSQASDD